ncbi:MAG: phosphate uptake regulator PhoU [Infirmifilum sp.]
MEARRIVKIGGSFYVALPKTWVLDRVGENGVVAVTVGEDGSLHIIPFREEKNEEKKVIRLRCGDDLYRSIISAYLRGYEVIEVSTSPECRDEVMRVAERVKQLLLGLELVGEETGLVTLQCFIRPDYDLYSIVQRMSSITLAMMKLVFQAFERTDVSTTDKILAMEDIIDRLYFLAVRIIRSRVSDPSVPSSEKLRLVDIRVIVRNLENIGDLLELLIRNSPCQCRIDPGMYEALSRFQRSVISIALGGEDSSRSEILALYRNLIERLENNGKGLPTEVYKNLENIIVLLKDILDLS